MEDEVLCYMLAASPENLVLRKAVKFIHSRDSIKHLAARMFHRSVRASQLSSRSAGITSL